MSKHTRRAPDEMTDPQAQNAMMELQRDWLANVAEADRYAEALALAKASADRPLFRDELEHLLNRYSMENCSNTPDFILADFIRCCLTAFDAAVLRRDHWYGVAHRPGATADTHTG